MLFRDLEIFLEFFPTNCSNIVNCQVIANKTIDDSINFTKKYVIDHTFKLCSMLNFRKFY
jgi:hypothetical protein